MAPFPNRVTLGRSGLSVCPLAISGGYGADAITLRKAFDRGVNYWYHGSIRRPGMTEAIRGIVAAGQRDQLVVVLQSYTRWPSWLERTFTAGLKLLGIDHADVLLLGWYNGMPPEAILDRAQRLREKGLFKALAISGHRRQSFLKFANDPRFDLLHIRYSAAHAGAEQDVFPFLGERGRPGIVAYTATAWGRLLSPKRMPSGEPPLRGRDCYRFVLSNPDFNACMTGPRDLAQMEEALAALDEGPISPEEEARIRRIGAHVHA